MTPTGSHATHVGSVDPYDVVARDETLAEVVAALDRLDERSRHVIQSTVLGDEPLTEVAARLGVSYQRVQQLRRRALEQLANLVTHGHRNSLEAERAARR
jgi:RNA polymerase sigma factor (sigma-70 family)